MIVFRILIGPQNGLGHLTRCLVLAKKLQEIGFSVVFIGDIIPQNIANFFNGFSYYSLYESMPQEWNQLHDAQSCINYLERYLAIEWVILDHYYLDAVWEGIIQNRGFKILAIDDLVRNHISYALVDFKWRGVDNQLAYRDKVHPSTRLLLGPQYLLAEVEDIGIQESAAESAPLRVLISFGGGGSGDDLVYLLQALTSELNSSKISIHLQVVIGPFLTNKNKLRKFPERQGCVTFEYIENKNNLIPFLQACDFYLGAAGGTIYHLRLLKKPALTFSLVANQFNNQSQLDDIGHYLHLNDFQFSQVNLISQLCVVLLKNYSRIKKLFNYSKVFFDSLGAERIANFLKTGQTSPCNFMQEVSEDWTIITGDYAVRAVQDSDINHYLACRNLQYNCKNMIDSRPIPVMDHYLWWFGTLRRSYLMAKQQKPILYIWDEVKYVENEPYLVGGWFVCSEQTSFQDSMVALDLTSETLIKAHQLLMEVEQPYVFPVVLFPAAPQLALKRSQSGSMSPLFNTAENIRTQDLEPAYFDAGQFYWGRADAWLQGLNIHQHGYGMPIASSQAVDIDILEDWQQAEHLYQTMTMVTEKHESKV